MRWTWLLFLGSSLLLAQPIFGQDFDDPDTNPDQDEIAADAEESQRNPLGVPEINTGIERFFDEPETLDEIWEALDRALRYGRVRDIDRHLRQLQGHPDFSPEAALALREKYGSGILIKLQLFPEYAEAARKISSQANEAARNVARDPKRIRYFIDRLAGPPDVRAYAIDQLRRSGMYTIPVFIDKLRERLSPDEHRAVVTGLYEMPKESWLPVAAALDSGDRTLVPILVQALGRFGVPESADALWYVTGSPRYSQQTRAEARQVLSSLLGVPASRLPGSAAELTRVAKRYYQHRSGLERRTGTVTVWNWNNDTLEPIVLSPTDAEEWYGMRAAARALELDPENAEAQLLFLSLLLEANTGRRGIDQAPLPSPSGSEATSLKVGPDLLARVLERAIREGRTAVVLGATRALGKVGRASLAQGDFLGTRVGLLVQAMNYPNSRVQLAAIEALLELAPSATFVDSGRAVDTLIRALDTSSRPVAAIFDGDSKQANDIAAALTQIGFEAENFSTGREGFRFAVENGGVELIVVSASIGHWGIRDTVANLRADARTAGIPILVISKDPERDRNQRWVREGKKLAVTAPLDDPAALARVLELSFDDPFSKPLSPDERLAARRAALDWTVRLARGELPYLDLGRTSDVLAALLTDNEHGPSAAEALGFLPSATNQQRLATAVLTESISLPTRIAAARALARNIQRSSVAIDQDAAVNIERLARSPVDPELDRALARLVGTFRPTVRGAKAVLDAYQSESSPLPSPKKGAGTADLDTDPMDDNAPEEEEMPFEEDPQDNEEQ